MGGDPVAWAEASSLRRRGTFLLAFSLAFFLKRRAKKELVAAAQRQRNVRKIRPYGGLAAFSQVLFLKQGILAVPCWGFPVVARSWF